MIVGTKVECSRITAGLQTMIIQEGKTCRWVVGGDPHPLQRGAFGPVVGSVRVTGLQQIPLRRLTEEDAHLLGFSCLASWRADWKQRHDGRWQGTLLVYALRVHYTGVLPEYHQRSVFDLLEEMKESAATR